MRGVTSPSFCSPGGRAADAQHDIDARRYLAVRSQTDALCAPLAIDDYGPQSMPDASPAKWHLAHTSWFFERFILQAHLPGYRCFHPAFDRLFNSYYQSLGPQHPRPARGLLSRPTVAEVWAYRRHVDAQMLRLFEADARQIRWLAQLGLHHEQQHQELLLTDLKHLLFCNPLQPAYRPPTGRAPAREADRAAPPPVRWCAFDDGLHSIGADPRRGFCFDNETPRHRCYTAAFALADRLVTNHDYREFVRDAGYRRPRLWLADGWPLAQRWRQPLYWSTTIDGEFTLEGARELDPGAPVCHLSYYEADAYARWAGARLPTEAEWERAAPELPPAGANFLDSAHLHPRAPDGTEPMTPAPLQLYGDVWEWTASAYLPYPGFRPWSGAVGEYNGKFMANQFVLRGGSCATARSHIRPSYRNFFYPSARWQFAGIRLAKDL